MAKITFDTIVNATLAAVVTGADRDHAAAVAFPLLAKASATIADLLRAERTGERVASAVVAARRTLIGGLRVILADSGIDVTNGKAVRDALRPSVWADEGLPMPEAGAAKPDAGTAALTTYERITTRVSRLARDIVDAPRVAPNKAKPRLASALVANVRAATFDADVPYADALAALKRVYGK